MSLQVTKQFYWPGSGWVGKCPQPQSFLGVSSHGLDRDRDREGKGTLRPGVYPMVGFPSGTAFGQLLFSPSSFPLSVSDNVYYCLDVLVAPNWAGGTTPKMACIL